MRVVVSVAGESAAAPRDPQVGDRVVIRGRITHIDAGTASVAVYRTDPVGLTVPVQCGALELDEHPGTGDVEPAAAEITCDLDYPVTAEQALAWAQQAQWFFRGYYKYEFTFEAYCTVAYPDDPEAHEVKATAEVYGETGSDIYRFPVSSGPMTWDELRALGTPGLLICDGDKELYRG